MQKITLSWLAIIFGLLFSVTGGVLFFASFKADVVAILYCGTMVTTGIALLFGKKWAAWACIGLGVCQVIDQTLVAIRLNSVTASAGLGLLVLGIMPVALGLYKPFRQVLTDSPRQFWRSAVGRT